jgi:hypothetical protein
VEAAHEHAPGEGSGLPHRQRLTDLVGGAGYSHAEVSSGRRASHSSAVIA